MISQSIHRFVAWSNSGMRAASSPPGPRPRFPPYWSCGRSRAISPSTVNRIFATTWPFLFKFNFVPSLYLESAASLGAMKEITLQAVLPIFTWRACELFYEDSSFEKRHLQGLSPPRSGVLGNFPSAPVQSCAWTFISPLLCHFSTPQPHQFSCFFVFSPKFRFPTFGKNCFRFVLFISCPASLGSIVFII